MIRYRVPQNWIQYDARKLIQELTDAKAAVLSLRSIPYRRSWAEALQYIQLKREVAGTSRIEGADFTEYELEAALKETPRQLHTRSQRQAHAALITYKWIENLPNDLPINSNLILEIHRLIVTGADDDHCPPGRLRERDQNVHFGYPRHRGAAGGEESAQAFENLTQAVQREFQDHDPLIQALALHYHLAAIHPFLDGNGRTARALEALILQRAGLRDTLFIAMSNYYYDEKSSYLAVLGETRANNHDLTPFLKFGLRGIALQCRQLFSEIRRQISKELFRNVMFDLFHRLETKRKRVIAERQIAILKLLLSNDSMLLDDIFKRTQINYHALKKPTEGLLRDLGHLIDLGAIDFHKIGDGRYEINLRLEWATEITETEFFEKVKRLPKAKSHPFL
jgi:Fic family protein